MNFLCNNNTWIIILLVIVLFYCNNDSCGNNYGSSCGCSNNCGCC